MRAGVLPIDAGVSARYFPDHQKHQEVAMTLAARAIAPEGFAPQDPQA